MKLAEIRDKDPLTLFQEWFAEAEDKEMNDANAMALATADGLAANWPPLRLSRFV